MPFLPPRANPCRSNLFCGSRFTIPADSPVSDTNASKIGSDASVSDSGSDLPTEIPVTTQTRRSAPTTVETIDMRRKDRGRLDLRFSAIQCWQNYFSPSTTKSRNKLECFLLTTLSIINFFTAVTNSARVCYFW